ncbi:MAG: hypothetical protein PVI90_07430 [Desulfobacteraceae bacterium]
MKIEIRTDLNNDIDPLFDLPVDCIGIGSETCVHQLFPAAKLLKRLERIFSSGRMGRVITPLIPNPYIEKVADLIRQIIQLEFPIAISVNDYGLLYKCRSLHRRGEQEFCIGRLLAKSVDNWPWKDQIVKDEEPNIKDNLLQNNCCYNRKLEFLKQYGVSSVELNLKPSQLKYLNVLEKYEFKILVHIDYILLAVSRSCPIVRQHKLSIPDCMSACKDSYTLNLADREGLQRSNNTGVDDEVFRAYPELIVWGNGVYQKNEESLLYPTLRKADHLVITQYNQNKKDLDKLFQKII